MVRGLKTDGRVTLSEHMEEKVDPVIVINKFNANPEDVDLFLKE